MDSYNELSQKIEELKKKSHSNCKTCQELFNQAEFWLKELYESREEIKVLSETLACDNALAMKKRRLETEEFEALENLDDIVEEIEEHLEI